MRTKYQYEQISRSVIGLVLSVTIMFCLSGCVPQASGVEEADLVRVVDGDTLIVPLNGSEERVRLLGIDCPESVNPDPAKNTPEGERASEYAKSLLTEGQILYIEKDRTDRDPYDRLLRYVWLHEPESRMVTLAVAEQDMLNM